MISTELATRILLTVIIVGAFTINYSTANGTGATTTNSSPSSPKKDEQSKSVKPKTGSVNSNEQLDSPVALSSSSPPTSVESARSFEKIQIISQEADAQTRLLSDSAEAGILLPYDDDFPQPGGSGGDNPRGFPLREEFSPEAITFPGKPLGLRIANGKALEQPRESYYGMDPGQAFKDDMKKTPTYFVRNSCFGPRCPQQSNNNNEQEQSTYFSHKEGKAKKYDGVSRSSNMIGPATKYEDNIMESMSSNFHSQLAIPFMVVDDSGGMKGNSLNSKYSNRLGLPDRFSGVRTTTSTISPEGWVKLKAISPDAYDPFRFTKNQSMKGDGSSSSFSKRDSSSASNKLIKRVGIELNPESFADRWGWNDNNPNDQDRRTGSRLPAWLEDQLKFGNGNRNPDQDKNWVKLEPIPVAGVTISKWVPKGTALSNLPTTSWQNNRDRPNAGSPWWDRIDDNRISSGSRQPFLRPNGGNDDRYPNSQGGGGGGGGGGGWGSKGSPLSTFDRYPTNSWNDIIYPEGPQSATVSWQQSKGGISGRPSSFPASGGSGGGWGSGNGGSDSRPPIATGSWSAPPNSNRRHPPSGNRYNDHRASSYPMQQASDDDPRWVLISNTRRVTSGSSGPNYPNRGNNDLLDRSKILSYINRLHPDLDRRGEYPFYDSSNSHRHGKDYWPLGSTSTFVVSPNKDEAFRRVNATLSTLTPVLIHRGGTTVSQQFGDSSQSQPARFEASVFQGGDDDDAEDPSSNSNTDYSSSDPVTGITGAPYLTPYLGDGRATSNSAPLLQSSTSTPFRYRHNFPGRIRQGLRNLNPIYAAVGAGMIPATLAAVMPMMLGRRRRRRDISNMISQFRSLKHSPYFLLSSALYHNNHRHNHKLKKYSG